MQNETRKDVLFTAEANKNWSSAMSIGGLLLFILGFIYLFIAISYMTSVEEAQRNLSIMISIYVVLYGVFCIYKGIMWENMFICACKEKLYISKGIKMSDKLELSYNDILNVSGNRFHIRIATKNNTIGLAHIKDSNNVITSLQKIVNEKNNMGF